MPPAAVAVVLLSAVAHVYWNYRLKQSPAPVQYAAWIMALGSLLVAPLALWTEWPPRVPPIGWACVGGTAVLYALYFTCIGQSYRSQDLSRAYPIARGVAPAATAGWGVFLHHEQPSFAGWLRIAAIAVGVTLLAWMPGRDRGRRFSLAGVGFAIGTGLCTSAYSVIDKEGVQHVAPSVYLTLTFAAGALLQMLLLLPGAGGRRLMAELRRAGPGLWIAAGASAGGYLLVLGVLRSEPVSYVVPLRSVAVLLSVMVGARLLGESGTAVRLLAAMLIVGGITAIAVGG